MNSLAHTIGVNHDHAHITLGDYRIGETLLAESASVIAFASKPPPPPSPPVTSSDNHSSLSLPLGGRVELSSLSNMFSRSRTPSPEPTLTALPPPPTPRRLVILVVGLKPHRTLWTTSARPSESVLQYQLLNGCPAIVVPVKLGAPLVAWDTLTLDHLWEVHLPTDDESEDGSKFNGIVTVLFEFLDFCVDWDRVVLVVEDGADSSEMNAASTANTSHTDDFNAKKATVQNAVRLLVAAAVRSGSSKEAKRELDKDRSGIAMWRIP